MVILMWELQWSRHDDLIEEKKEKSGVFNGLSLEWEIIKILNGDPGR